MDLSGLFQGLHLVNRWTAVASPLLSLRQGRGTFRDGTEMLLRILGFPAQTTRTLIYIIQGHDCKILKVHVYVSHACEACEGARMSIEKHAREVYF